MRHTLGAPMHASITAHIINRAIDVGKQRLLSHTFVPLTLPYAQLSLNGFCLALSPYAIIPLLPHNEVERVKKQIQDKTELVRLDLLNHIQCDLIAHLEVGLIARRAHPYKEKIQTKPKMCKLCIC
jgi:hypothetical protein